MNHTDGPWQLDQTRIIGNIDGGYGDDGSKVRFDTICNMEDEYGDLLPNWKDNARLIVAAPELLETLEAFVVWANIPDGGPSQYLRDKALKLINQVKK